MVEWTAGYVAGLIAFGIVSGTSTRIETPPTARYDP